MDALEPTVGPTRPLLNTDMEYYCQRCHAPCSQHDLLVGAHTNHDYLPIAEALLYGPSSLLRETKQIVSALDDNYFRPRRAQEQQSRLAVQTLYAARDAKFAEIARLHEEIDMIDKDITESEERTALAACHWHHQRQQQACALRRLEAGSRALWKLLEFDAKPVRGVETDEMILVDRLLKERPLNSPHVLCENADGDGGAARTRDPPCGSATHRVCSAALTRGSAHKELTSARALARAALHRLLADDPLDTMRREMRLDDQHEEEDESQTDERAVAAAARSESIKTVADLTSQRLHPSDGVLALLQTAISAMEKGSASRRGNNKSRNCGAESSRHVRHDEGGLAEEEEVDFFANETHVRSAEDAPRPCTHAQQRSKDAETVLTTSSPARRARMDAWQHDFSAFVDSLKVSAGSASSPSYSSTHLAREGARGLAKYVEETGDSKREGSSGACSSITQFQRDALSNLEQQQQQSARR